MTATEEKWSERIREWRQMGLSAEKFARDRGFSASNLRAWSTRLERNAKGVGAAVEDRRTTPVGMALVVPKATSSATMTVRVRGAAVEIRSGFDGRLLRELVEALSEER